MNFSHNISKSSLRSSSSSSKSIYQSEEIIKLENIIETLQHNNETLKKSLEKRDTAIAILTREKEKIYEELKCAQRTNRNLYQQLTDERDIHFKEKEYLVQDIKRLSIRRETNTIFETRCEGERIFSSLEEEIQEKDRIIYNICTKYLKVKSSKMSLQKRFIKLQKQSKKMCDNIVSILEENREVLDALLNRLLKMSHISKPGKKFIKLLQINTRLHYENTQLKIQMTHENEISSRRGLSVSNIKFQKNNIFEDKDKNVLITKTPQLRRSLSTNATYFIRRHGGLTNFKSLHNSLSPHFRKEICKSKSDSNLAYFK
ncbi:PREDICTED: uncharacterized protein LOC106116111 [Papilio xuthus]|uniref:Uncharacterized protein LOC106116111 n=1 Tax=Papilio xuthus TaxID=66420 RepID=A0AAJ6Z4M3_PAPXU|nr:PREDICTED: uncharacterized protein LOC106116111 [Papilio xuthus]